MKLTAYRLAVLGLTNVLTALVFFALGGGYGQRLEREAKAKAEATPQPSPVDLAAEIRNRLREEAKQNGL